MVGPTAVPVATKPGENEPLVIVHRVQLDDDLAPVATDTIGTDWIGTGCGTDVEATGLVEATTALAGIPVDTVWVDLFSVANVLVCLSNVWSLHKAEMRGRSRLRLFSRNDSMSNTVVSAVIVDAVGSTTADARLGRTTAAGFCNPVMGGGGGGGRLRNNTLGGTAGAAVNRLSCENVRTGNTYSVAVGAGAVNNCRF